MINPNPVGLNGIEFVEFASPDPSKLHRLFVDFGFSQTDRHESGDFDLYQQNDIHMILNRKPQSHAAQFTRFHGPSIPAMGWRVKDPMQAFEVAVSRGAVPAAQSDYYTREGKPIPAVMGIGGSLIYFVSNQEGAAFYEKVGFLPFNDGVKSRSCGFTLIDHLTNNVEKGTMQIWADFYKNIFGFTEVRYFDIQGVKTGLQSYALRSPCGKFCIPINEANEEKSQINEYIREYHGPGIQHLAFLTDNILESLERMKGTEIETLDIDPEYYQEVFQRVPNVKEDRQKIEKEKVLVDGDEDGYLLQIFTKNLVGPIFIEIIQRNNHLSFGEGNFGALFRSIERDQEKRGVFKA